MFCIAFGLSMDYEVFLLSRIKEEHDRTGDNVHVGRHRSGEDRSDRDRRCRPLVGHVPRLRDIAASRSSSCSVSGLALAVVMDATVVRGVLVPAFMRLAGNANWWAPAPLRRLHARIGFSEHSGDDDVDDDVDLDEPGMPTPHGLLVSPRQVKRIESARGAVASLRRSGVSPDLFR